MAGKRRALVSTVETDLIDSAEALVREKGAVPRAKLPRWTTFTPEAQTRLVEALLSRGLEQGDKGALRVPLREQAASLSAGGARLSLKAAQKRVTGASAKDRDAAIAAACEAGQLHLVVRTKIETVTGAAEQVLPQRDIDSLVKAHAELGAVLARVRKKGAKGTALARVPRTLLAEDAASLVAAFTRWSAPPAPPPDLDLDAVLEAIELLEQPPILLVWVPDLVRSLAPRMPVKDVHRALLAGRAARRLELRPESGVGRLSAEDEALCLRDPDDNPLSHVRRLAEA